MAYEKSVLTKEKIIKKSKYVFSKNGYKKTTMRMIAIEADINPSLVYYYFNGKRDVVVEIMNEFAEKMERVLEKHVEPEENYFVFMICLIRLIYREISKNEKEENFYNDIFAYVPPRKPILAKWYKALKLLTGDENLTVEKVKIALIIGGSIWSGLVYAKQSNEININMEHLLDIVDIMRFSYLQISMKTINKSVEAANDILKRVPIQDVRLLI